MQPSRETLVELLELQKIDSAISRLEFRRRNLPEQDELDSLNHRLMRLEAALGDQQVLADDCASRQRRLDADIDSLEKKIAAEEERLFAGKVANPRELAALQAEIESLKRRKGSVEEQDLEVMEERETVDKRLEALHAEEAQLKQAVNDAAEKKDRAVGEIRAEMESATAERTAWADKFDADLLGLYEDLRASKAGVAIAALTDGTCQGCHMKLPAQDVVRIRRSEGIVKCTECGRMLVVD